MFSIYNDEEIFFHNAHAHTKCYHFTSHACSMLLLFPDLPHPQATPSFFNVTQEKWEGLVSNIMCMESNIT